jgi:hypothetical protein
MRGFGSSTVFLDTWRNFHPWAGPAIRVVRAPVVWGVHVGPSFFSLLRLGNRQARTGARAAGMARL